MHSISRQIKHGSILIIFQLFTQQLFADSFYNVTDHGVNGNGVTINTKNIQKVIDECAAKGGGTIFFPTGKYISGTIFFRSNITLYLDAGAELLGNTDLADYPSTIPALRSYTDQYTERSLIYAEKLDHISIIGQGTINGQGDKFPIRTQPLKVRPFIIRMIECTNIRLKDVTLKNGAMWTQHYLACENLFIDNIHVDSRAYNVNNDGIDLDGCSRVMISNSYFITEDDAITFKSTLPRPCKNITISNCIVSSLCNAFKWGTESVGGFENITITNCVIFNTRYSGIALESIDGGKIKNINISNIVMDNVSAPIFIRLGSRMRPYIKDDIKREIGTIENVNISNIFVTGAGGFTNDMLSPMYLKAKAFANPLPIGSSILGIPGHSVKNVIIKDITIDHKGGGTKMGNTVPENENIYPDYDHFGDFPSYAFYCRHVDGLKFENVKVTYRAPEPRPAIWLDDVTNVSINSLDAQYEKGTDALIVAERSHRLLVTNCNYFDPLKALVNFVNRSSGAVLQHNTLERSSRPYTTDNTIDKRTIILKD
jgi:hypothetical protein